MAKTPAAAPPVAQILDEGVFETTLEDFCASLSQTVTRPELITAFYRSEKRAGTVKALASEFQARLDTFINRPA